MQRLGRIIGNVLAVMLTVFSIQAMAERNWPGATSITRLPAFPLTGGHATAACETCHVAGVFKGTAKTCDGCHALGKRVVATPKSTSHIVTDAPCETCHFNASTFLGARFNHGTALPGQCTTCHNGRQSMGKPASHSSGLKATKSCDNCHRSLHSWFQASWNHVGVVPGTCSTVPRCPRLVKTNTRSGNAITSELCMANILSVTYCHNFVRMDAARTHARIRACAGCHNGSDCSGNTAGHIDIGHRRLQSVPPSPQLPGWGRWAQSRPTTSPLTPG